MTELAAWAPGALHAHQLLKGCLSERRSRAGIVGWFSPHASGICSRAAPSPGGCPNRRPRLDRRHCHAAFWLGRHLTVIGSCQGPPLARPSKCKSRWERGRIFDPPPQGAPLTFNLGELPSDAMLSTFAPVTMGYAPTVAPAPSTVLRATAPAMAEVRRSRGGKAQGLDAGGGRCARLPRWWWWLGWKTAGGYLRRPCDARPV